MRVLVLHNRYRESGGEDAVVAAEGKMLAEHGHVYRLFQVDNDSIRGPVATLATALRVHYSRPSRRRVAAELEAFAPDVVHVHNFFPLLSPSVYDACRDAGVPVVQTLHNYRPICPSAYLLKDGRIWEVCVGGSAYRAVPHRLYRGSLVGTLSVARMIEYHKRRRTWHRKVDRFIALTAFVRDKFVEAGFPAERIEIKPNFTADPGERGPAGAGEYALFVGRLSPEKGLATLLDAWRDVDFPLRVAGDGPLAARVRAAAPPGVQILGRLDAAEVGRQMDGARFVVVPSEWFETFGMVVIEAFARGRPVLASRIGGMAELIDEGVNGHAFEAGSRRGLVEAAARLAAHPDRCALMGRAARETYLRRFTPTINHRRLIEIYRGAGAS